MKALFVRYLNEIVGLTVMALMALALIASGISLRREAQVRMAQRFGTTVKAGSMRRMVFSGPCAGVCSIPAALINQSISPFCAAQSRTAGS